MERPDPTAPTPQDAGWEEAAEAAASAGADALASPADAAESGPLSRAEAAPADTHVDEPGGIGWKSVQLTPRQESPPPPAAVAPTEPEPAPPATPPPAPGPSALSRASRWLRARLGAVPPRWAAASAGARAAARRLRARLAVRGRRTRAVAGDSPGGAGAMLVLLTANDVLLAATIAMLLLG